MLGFKLLHKNLLIQFFMSFLEYPFPFSSSYLEIIGVHENLLRVNLWISKFLKAGSKPHKK